MTQTADILIAGAGLAGLSLAVELAKPAFAHLRVVLVEPRAQHVRDRTWSYFAGAAHAFSHLERHQWPAWQVGVQGGPAVRHGAASPRSAQGLHPGAQAGPGPAKRDEPPVAAYASIDADRFYDAALATIAAAPHIQLLRGFAVGSVAAHPAGGQTVELQPAPGAPTLDPRISPGLTTLLAHWVFDSRPDASAPSPAARPVSALHSRAPHSPAPDSTTPDSTTPDSSAPDRLADPSNERPRSPNDLYQHFEGWEVQAHSPCAAFDPGIATLMSFVAHPQGLHFFYLLPYSTSCALVESTWISPAHVQPDHAADLAAFLREQCALTQWDTRFTERGRLPLKRRAPSPSSANTPTRGYMRIGQAGGTLRPATGYAFLETLQHSGQIAGALQRGQTPQPYQAHPLDAWMDDVFLDVLRSNWVDAPELFVKMFTQNTAADLVAFLNGRANLRVRTRVAASLPPRPFIAAAIRRAVAQPFGSA